MNYELAKELKDAGYWSLQGSYWDGDPKDWDREKFPTLEELIETCGDKFDYLERGTKGGWFAYHENFGTTEEESCDDSGEGSTPKEAVARLWLALNKT